MFNMAPIRPTLMGVLNTYVVLNREDARVAMERTR